MLAIGARLFGDLCAVTSWGADVGPAAEIVAVVDPEAG